MENEKSNWKGKIDRKTGRKRGSSIKSILRTTCKYRKMQKAIKKAQKTKTGISRLGILTHLQFTKDFIGVYAEDQVSNLSITTFPSSLIINIDPSHMRGSHWLAIRISRYSLEIFDPLGFQILSWPRIPCHLLNFLRRWSSHRRTIISPVIQSHSSVLCGFYCIAYIVCRQVFSFNEFLKFFKTPEQNDNLLLNVLS